MLKAFLRKNYKWIIFLILVSACSLLAELINSKMEMADLEVYYKAADRLIGGEELYRGVEDDPYEHYVYKYSPPAVLLFVPLLPFGFTVAKFIYWMLLTFIMGSVLFNTRSILNVPHKVYISLILGIIITGTHFFRELHLGQVNLLLLGIYVYSLLLLNRKKPAGFGALIAISIFIKPFGLIFVPLLFLMRRWKELMYLAGFAMILLILPFVFYGNIHEYIGLYQSWATELGIELGSKQELIHDGNHTIFSVLARYSPLAYFHIEGLGRILYQLAILLLIGAFLLWVYFWRPVPERDTRLYFVLTAMIPLLAFTSYNAFIFTLPLVLYLLFKFRELNIFFRVMVIFSCVIIGVNIYDLVGPKLFDSLWAISVYTWGTLGLMLVLFFNWNKFSNTI